MEVEKIILVRVVLFQFGGDITPISPLNLRPLHLCLEKSNPRIASCGKDTFMASKYR